MGIETFGDGGSVLCWPSDGDILPENDDGD